VLVGGSVSLADVSLALRRHAIVVCAIVVVSAVGALGVASMMPSRYRATATLAVHVENPAGRAGLGSLPGEIGGLASALGLDAATSSTRYEAIEFLKARSTASRLIQDKDLLSILFAERWDATQKQWRRGVEPPSLADAVRRFERSVRMVTEDRRTGLVTLAITWRDPRLAAEWATALIAIVNDEMRRAAIDDANQTLIYLKREIEHTEHIESRNALYRLIEAEERSLAVAAVREDYALRTIDPATPPDAKDRIFPQPALFASLGALAGLALAALYVAYRARRDALKLNPN
jgi:uncharacterized protein involved in exopolysaccharide biosynthesis